MVQRHQGPVGDDPSNVAALGGILLDDEILNNSLCVEERWGVCRESGGEVSLFIRERFRLLGFVVYLMRSFIECVW